MNTEGNYSNNKGDGEVEKRERLVQTYLIISGFLVAYTQKDLQPLFVLLFTIYLLPTILYYVFLSRTKLYPITAFLALMSSYSFSMLITFFIIFQVNGGYSSTQIIFMQIFLTAILTYCLIPPSSTLDKIFYLVENKLESFENKHPKLIIIIGTITALSLAVLYYKWVF